MQLPQFVLLPNLRLAVHHQVLPSPVFGNVITSRSSARSPISSLAVRSPGDPAVGRRPEIESFQHVAEIGLYLLRLKAHYLENLLKRPGCVISDAPAADSHPFKTMSYWLVKIPGMFFLAIRSSMNSGFGAENGLWVHVPTSLDVCGEPVEPLCLYPLRSPGFRSSLTRSKNGKSIIQQKASSFGSFLSLRKSGRLVPYFSFASA